MLEGLTVAVNIQMSFQTAGTLCLILHPQPVLGCCSLLMFGFSKDFLILLCAPVWELKDMVQTGIIPVTFIHISECHSFSHVIQLKEWGSLPSIGGLKDFIDYGGAL